MKLFAIWLCIAIGSVFGELGRRQFAKENLEVNEDSEEVRALISLDDGEKPYSSDESLRVKYARDNSFDQIASSAKEADSIEKEISKNRSPLIETSIVKPSSSKTIRKILEIMHLWKPAKHVKELREIARRNRTESKTLQEVSFNFLKRLFVGTAALIRKTTNLGGSSRKFLRRKRETTEVADPPDAMESLKVCAKLRKKLPVALRLKMLNTDEIEEKMLEAYAETKVEPVDIVSKYNSAKMAEREQLRQAMVAASKPEAGEMKKTYKTLRKGTPWNCLRLRGKFKRFFATPSEALTEYEQLKKDELESVDGFLLEYIQFAAKARQQQEEDVIEEDIDEVNAEDFPNNRARLPEMMAGKRKRSAEEEQQFTTGSPKSEIGEVKDDSNLAQSRDEYLKLSEVFTEPLRIQMKNTDAAEKVVLISYVESDYVPDNLLDDYYAERAKEIQLLKAELAASEPKKAELLSVYKSIRKGIVWNFMKKGSKERQEFFKKTSAGRKEYEELKKKELEIDHYLDGSRPIESKAPDRDDKAEAEGIQRASAIEKDKARQDEDGTEKVDMATKNGDDPENVESSLKVQKDIQSRLSDWLSGRVTVTNTAEEALLDSYAEATTGSANLLEDYNDAKAKEREVLKLEMAGGGPEEAAMLANYKKLRKGAPWNSLRLQDKYKAFFDTPSAALTEYLDVKKDERSIDMFLTGENAVTVGSSGDMVTKYASGRARARVAERARVRARARARVRARVRAREDEMFEEELERKVRDKETVKVVFEVDAGGVGDGEKVVASSEDDDEDTEEEEGAGAGQESLDDDDQPEEGPTTTTKKKNRVTTTTTNKTNVKSNSNLLKTAFFFAMGMLVINVSLILGPQCHKIFGWCKRLRRTDDTREGETESLYTEKSIGFWNDPTRLSRKVRNAALM